MYNKENTMEKYAEVAVKVGLNLQKGQQLIIHAPVDAVDLVRIVTVRNYILKYNFL